MRLENHATKNKKPEFRLETKNLIGKGASYAHFSLAFVFEIRTIGKRDLVSHNGGAIKTTR